MEKLVEYLTRALVDHPDRVAVKKTESERAIIYEIRVDPSDAGKVIGKEGRTIKSIRTIISSAAAKSRQRVMVELLE
jgi:hypothetical protein